MSNLESSLNNNEGRQQPRNLCEDVKHLFEHHNEFIYCLDFRALLENVVLNGSNQVIIWMSPQDRNYMFEEDDMSNNDLY